jgi:hypothetical protein
MGSVPGIDCPCALNLKEPRDIFAVSAGCLPGPKVYVEEHLAPAVDLSFQLGIKGVPPAQKQTIGFLLGWLGAGPRRFARNVTYLAAGALPCVAPTLFFVLSHEKRLLCPPHTRYPPFCGAEPSKRRLEGASTHDADGYQATTSDCRLSDPKYPVYQVPSGVSVWQGTLCLITPSRP